MAEVCSVAKQNLAPGQRLDSIGETTYRSLTMTVEDARVANAIPCGLLEGGTVVEPIGKGELITHFNASVDPGSKLAQLREKQDALFPVA